MEAIGRVRKVKKKVKEGMEKIVEKVTHSEETNGTGEAKAKEGSSLASDENLEIDGETKEDAVENRNVNTITDSLDKVQVSRDYIKV